MLRIKKYGLCMQSWLRLWTLDWVMNIRLRRLSQVKALGQVMDIRLGHKRKFQGTQDRLSQVTDISSGQVMDIRLTQDRFGQVRLRYRRKFRLGQVMNGSFEGLGFGHKVCLVQAMNDNLGLRKGYLMDIRIGQVRDVRLGQVMDIR